jgi:S1-C subfamily serine protease
MNKKFGIALVLFSAVVSVSAAYFFTKHFSGNQTVVRLESTGNTNSVPVAYHNQTVSGVSFVEASKKTTPSVVFIKTESEVVRRSSFWFFDPFGSIGKVASTGSGVIISEDGYIVTNQHVIKNAQKIEVVLNNGKKNYEATVVGEAASSDLALLKIEATGLTPVEIENSDNVDIGEWVLAVGNPFNLTSTVTAGIVSAKGRNINIVQNQFPIESFIQTDAAINPGNSGGALVDLEGKLVGINTAIASKTGSYVGYGFAIPSNIVVKIVDDLKEFGQIQRGFDGLEIVDINDEILDLIDGQQNGVYVSRVSNTNKSIGNQIQMGDVVIGLNGKSIDNKAMYDEMLAYHRPGDEMQYTVLRDGKTIQADIKLVNKNGEYGFLKQELFYSEKLDAEFELVSKFELEHFGINQGIRVVKVGNGLIRKMNLPEGYIITSVNRVPADNMDEFMSELESARGNIRLSGVSPQGGKDTRSFYLY